MLAGVCQPITTFTLGVAYSHLVRESRRRIKPSFARIVEGDVMGLRHGSVGGRLLDHGRTKSGDRKRYLGH